MTKMINEATLAAFVCGFFLCLSGLLAIAVTESFEIAYQIGFFLGAGFATSLSALVALWITEDEIEEDE